MNHIFFCMICFANIQCDFFITKFSVSSCKLIVSTCNKSFSIVFVMLAACQLLIYVISIYFFLAFHMTSLISPFFRQVVS